MFAYGRAGIALSFACLTAALLACVLLLRPMGAGAVGGELVAQPVFGAPAGRFLGTAPQEAPGEAWALARGRPKIVRYTDAGGWETLPGPLGPGEQPLAELTFAEGPMPGRTTPAGGVAVLGRTKFEQVLIVRDPGGQPHTAPAPGEALHDEEGESLFSDEDSAGVLLAPVEEPDGSTGVFDVPAVEPPARQEAVLDFDGNDWGREPICTGFEAAPVCTGPPSPFRVLAIDAAGPGDAWLLAKGAAPGEGLALFEREAGGGSGGEAVWRQRQLGPPGSVGSLFAQAAPQFPQPSPAPPLTVAISARTVGQPLTVTGSGVWVDAKLKAGGESSDATVYYDVTEERITGSWCDVVAAAGLCEFELGTELAAGAGRSFAWPPDGGSEAPYGKRLITGLGAGAILALEGTVFTRLAVAGGSAGTAEGAALGESTEGWLGANPPVHLTRAPAPDKLVPWPVPFRRPLTAIAPQPGTPVADLASEALAVGVDGEVARYLPGQGWVAESLLTGSGARARPTLRAVAWPEPGRAYAVGDGTAMWVWQKATELWEPDPAEPPNLVRANFTGIAFDSDEPNRGFAVGKQGLLLRYGRQWTQEPLPTGVDLEANFTSVAFAGDEAIVTFKIPFDQNGTTLYRGGVLIEDGSGWRVDEAAEEALAGDVPQLVAGLSDGGAAIVSEEHAGSGEDTVIERDGPSAPWLRAPEGATGYPAALAAFREGGVVRAAISVSPGHGLEDIRADREQVYNQPAPGQPPLLTSPYPLPGSGFIMRQAASGWRDEEHQAYPLPSPQEGQEIYDLPRRPDPVLALLLSPDGGQGWAVGGETGSSVRFQGTAIQTAGVIRYGPTATPPGNATESPLEADAGMASFAIGGNAQCAGPCADLAGTGIGPDVWLRSAIGRAAGIAGLRAFLYTGPSVASGSDEGGSVGLSSQVGPLAFRREEVAYARRLGSVAPSLPLFAAPAASDLDRSGGLAAFENAFSGFGAPFGGASPGSGIVPRSSTGPGQGYYSFDSQGAGGPVRAIVLDYSRPVLGQAQSCWLAGQLVAAGEEGTAAIVVGYRDLGGQAPNAAQDADQVLPILVDGAPPPGCSPEGEPSGASAYFFDFPEENRSYRLTSGGRSIPAFGSGTLGYLEPRRPQETDFVGASGFLFASVDVHARDEATNVAPVDVRLIPNIAALALDAADGTLVRRSHVALFTALARRPLAGAECSGSFAPVNCEAIRPDPYVPIPSQCQGARCASAISPEYSFSSSNPDIADFVAVDPGSPNPRQVLLGKEDKPIADASSGLLCAFNAGTTTVTVSTGGLSYSKRVTVLGGTAQRPCGTTPLRNPPEPAPGVEPPPIVGEQPGFEGGSVPLAPPPPPAPAPAPHPAVHQAPAAPLALTPFVAPTVTATPIVPIVPPPPVPAGQPTPPSGTSPVTEREEETAFDLVHHMSAERLPAGSAAAVLASDTTASGGSRDLVLLPALVGLAALAGAGATGRRRRPPLAYETTTSRRTR